MTECETWYNARFIAEKIQQKVLKVFQAKIYVEPKQCKKCKLLITDNRKRYVSKGYLHYVVQWSFSHTVARFEWRDSWSFQSTCSTILLLYIWRTACLSEVMGKQQDVFRRYVINFLVNYHMVNVIATWYDENPHFLDSLEQRWHGRRMRYPHEQKINT